MKRILLVIAFVVVVSLQASAQAKIHQVQACREIGNIEGAGDVTCIDSGGRDLRSAGRTFRDGDKIFILVRFRKLPVGSVHRLRVLYQLRQPDGRYRQVDAKELTFRNKGEGWAHWFPAHYKQTGQWWTIVTLLGRSQSWVKYCVNCPGE